MAKRSKKGRDITGIVIVDKPTGLSSNHVLQRVKRLFNANKAGHTGSLDPLATGVYLFALAKPPNSPLICSMQINSIKYVVS